MRYLLQIFGMYSLGDKEVQRRGIMNDTGYIKDI